MRKILLFAFGIYSAAFGAANDISHHSRANCHGFNESISWDGSKAHYFAVTGQHYSGTNLKHSIPYHPAYTYRAAAYCLNSRQDLIDEVDNVVGLHAISEDNQIWNQESTNASGCMLYNGWYEISGDILEPPTHAIDLSDDGGITVPGDKSMPLPSPEDGLGYKNMQDLNIGEYIDLVVNAVKFVWSLIFG